MHKITLNVIIVNAELLLIVFIVMVCCKICASIYNDSEAYKLTLADFVASDDMLRHRVAITMCCYMSLWIFFKCEINCISLLYQFAAFLVQRHFSYLCYILDYFLFQILAVFIETVIDAALRNRADVVNVCSPLKCLFYQNAQFSITFWGFVYMVKPRYLPYPHPNKPPNSPLAMPRSGADFLSCILPR